MPRNLDKFLFIATGSMLVLGAAFGAGLYSAYTKNALYRAVAGVTSQVSLVVSERANLLPGGPPVHYLQPARTTGSGVVTNLLGDDGSLVLISSFFDGNPGLRLIRRDGTVVAHWPAKYTETFPDAASFLHNPPATDHNVDLHGAVMNPDGSVVFNYEYAGTVKLGRCGEMIWKLPHRTHHSVERSERSGYWILGRDYIPGGEDRFPPFTARDGRTKFADDLILKVTEDGEIESAKSIVEILYDNGLESLLTATGFSFLKGEIWNKELVHSNKVAELPAAFAAAFPQFEPGDLAVSLREYNLLFVVDPDDWSVKWHQTGPWIRQHDPEFGPNGTITLFNNNTYRYKLGPNDQVDLKAPEVSNIMNVDPRSGEAVVIYGGRSGEALSSVIRGKVDLVPGGDVLITEFEGGRAFQIDLEGRIVWDYVNRFDDDHVLEITEARRYSADYFTVADWSCP